MPNSQDDVQRKLLARSILMSCAIRHGGLDSLAVFLGVERETLTAWVSGRSDPPVEIVQRAVEPFLKPTSQ